ncbi:MAG: hypothetical protein R3B95_03335 [Nitrospirales bacterium]|nr:hypothetical protein [Nitrospirales bacterium]
MIVRHLLWRALQPWTVHLHEHHHEEVPHSHAHGQDYASHSHHLRWSRTKVLFEGFVHNLADSAALSLSVRTTMPSIEMGMVYILFFSLGSIGSILMMSGQISLLFVYLSQ